MRKLDVQPTPQMGRRSQAPQEQNVPVLRGSRSRSVARRRALDDLGWFMMPGRVLKLEVEFPVPFTPFHKSTLCQSCDHAAPIAGFCGCEGV
jgi:hypothetical protein